jgi:hypothetical protein
MRTLTTTAALTGLPINSASDNAGSLLFSEQFDAEYFAIVSLVIADCVVSKARLHDIRSMLR